MISDLYKSTSLSVECMGTSCAKRQEGLANLHHLQVVVRSASPMKHLKSIYANLLCSTCLTPSIDFAVEPSSPVTISF